jgi:hypothetical protein
VLGVDVTVTLLVNVRVVPVPVVTVCAVGLATMTAAEAIETTIMAIIPADTMGLNFSISYSFSTVAQNLAKSQKSFAHTTHTSCISGVN